MFFFTELDKVNTQTSAQAIGPVMQSYYDYQLTNKLRLKANAKAFMPVTGTVLVVPQGSGNQSNVVNVIIKVAVQPTTGYTPISYIIYRGIRKDSIFTTTGELLPAGRSDLLTHVWRNWQNSPGVKTSNGPTTDAVGWAASTTLDPEKSLGNIFNPGTGLTLPTIKEGSTLGIFTDTADVGIDIILYEGLMIPQLKTAYGSEAILTIAAPLSQEVSEKREREKVLAYLDISTFYALGDGAAGVSYVSATGTTPQKALNAESIYNTLLQQFRGRNTVYLDLRNEVSASLNHYSEYQNSNDPPHTPLFFWSTTKDPLSGYDTSWHWPLFPLEGLSGESDAELRLAFRTTYNPDPLIYREYGELSQALIEELGKGEQNKFISLYNNAYNDILYGPPKDLSKEIVFKLPKVRNGAGRAVSMSTIIKMMVLRRTTGTLKANDVTYFATPADAPPRENYLDNVFGPIHPLASSSLVNDTPQSKYYPKRWLCQGDIESRTITGYIVQPITEYTSAAVVLKAAALASYTTNINQTSIERPLSDFGVQVSLLGPENKYKLEKFGQVWEKSTLGGDMHLVEVSTASVTEVAVLGYFGQAKPSDAVVFSLTFTRAEYDALATEAAFFDQNLGEVYCFFRPFTMEKTNSAGLNGVVISTTLTLGGYVGNIYKILTPNQLGFQGRFFSVNYQNFSTAASGAASALPVVAPAEDYFISDYLADLRTAERAYATRDVRIDQAVTRQRVHFYGYVEEDTRSNSWKIWENKGNVKGYIFNLYIPRANYWELEPDAFWPCEMADNNSQNPRPAPPMGITFHTGCQIRQMRPTDPGMSINLIRRLSGKNLLDTNGQDTESVHGLHRGAIRIIDPGNHILDIGHALFTLDALFTGAELNRLATPTPSPGFQALHINGIDLATFMGDLTIAIGDALFDYEVKPVAFQAKYNFHDYFDLVYFGSSSMTDLFSDADGYGLNEAWEKGFKRKVNMPLSDLIAFYYSNDSPKEYSYRSRWKIACLRSNFVVFDNTIQRYRWAPDFADLTRRLRDGYNLTYSIRSQQISIGGSVAAGGLPPDALAAIPALEQVDSDYVLTKFLNQIKDLLRQEQPDWDVVY